MISVAYAAAEEHAAASGMPQFESSVFGHQIFWSVASFLLLLYLLKRFVLPAIEGVLDARSHKIKNDIEKAEEARSAAEKHYKEMQAQLASSRQLAAQTMEDTRLEASRYRELAIAELNEELARKRDAAVRDIEVAKHAALAEVQVAVADMVVLATEKLIAKSVDRSDADRMVRDSLAEITGSSINLH